MSVDPKTCQILLAGEPGADVMQVRDLLAPEFDRIEVSVQGELAVADFERVRPDVVVLAFHSLDKAQSYCLGLLRLSKTARDHAHRTVILCAKEELRAVFELCKKDHFDDYVLFWPQAFDGTRLVMAVWNACRRRAAAGDAAADRDSLAAQAQTAQALEAVVGRQLDRGMQQVAVIEQSLVDAERGIGASADAGRFRQAIAASRDSVAPMSAWANGFRAEVAPHAARARALAGRPADARPFVLVVEDDAFAAKLIGKALEHPAFEVRAVSNAPAVLSLLRSAKPLVILMDVNLPGMDGLSLTEWLKASPTLAQIPVIMLTGDSRRETIDRSKTAGAAGFIVKPFTRDGLLAKLARYLP